MPNSRRRKFSVRNGIAARGSSKPRNDLQTSASGPDSEHKSTNNNTAAIIQSKSKNKVHPNSSKNVNNIDLPSECESFISMVSTKKLSAVDKDVTADSSNIDLFNQMYTTKDFSESSIDRGSIVRNESSAKRVTRPTSRERTPLKREKYLRQHRIKVRSPKRRMGIGILETQNKTDDIEKVTSSIGTEAINWDRECETETCEVSSANVAETNDDDERLSDHSSDDMCRICHGGDSLSQELGQLISACSCRGTVGRVHVKCLERWLTESGKSRCELCGTRYITRRVHRYGVPRALVMWILSQNAKQLMVDSLGIMLMSPLAVLAAWLSGRTLAGLMTQDAHATPWPLASTFVLACMTLVCYYCWIVSAATRHALGWWIWYRSQYEVRLQLLEEEE